MIEEVPEIKGGPIHQYSARVTKLSKIFQESNFMVKVTRQEEGPGQQSKSGSDAREVNRDQHVYVLWEQRMGRVSSRHNERVSAWAD